MGGQSAKFCNLHHNHRDNHHNCHDHHYKHQDNDQSRKGGRSVGLGVSQQKIYNHPSLSRFNYTTIASQQYEHQDTDNLHQDDDDLHQDDDDRHHDHHYPGDDDNW